MYPLYNRDYYLLDHNNGDFKYQEFIKSFFFLTSDPKPFLDKINKKEIDSKNKLLFLKNMNKYFENLSEILRIQNSDSSDANILKKISSLDLDKLYHSDFNLILKNLYNLMVWVNRYQRELELLAINEKVYLNLLSFDNTPKRTKHMEKCLKYFSNRYHFSNADIIIRFSTESCWLNISNSYVFLPMIDYEYLLCDFFNTSHDLP